jgi:hypothetical protein
MADGNLASIPVPDETQQAVAQPIRPFRALTRFLQRVLLFYWICFTFPFPLDLIGLPLSIIDPEGQPPWFQPVSESYKRNFDWVKSTNEYFRKGITWIDDTEAEVCKWVGTQVLHVEVVIQPTGSGDTMRFYVGCLCAGVIALGLALVWSGMVWVVRRSRPNFCPDPFLDRTVRALVRFFLFQMLLGYGFAKVFPVQFAPPSSYRLAQQLGDMSPMGLLWTFMGFSTVYQMFTGWVEVIAGLCLVTRRTTLLGALLSTLAMGQVFVLNMCFDVPVKLYSFHYLIMSIFLVVPDLGRLINLLILGRAVPARSFPPLLGHMGLDRAGVVFRTLLVLLLLYSQIGFCSQRWVQMYGGASSPVAGRWDVVDMKIDDKAVAKNDPAQWSSIDFVNKGLVRVSFPNGQPKMAVYRLEWHKDESRVDWTPFAPPQTPVSVEYKLPEPDKLELKGTFNGKPYSVTLKPAPEKQYELMNRGFHWVSEFPYNR